MKKPSCASEDRRRFEAEYPNDLWQSDVMHGPYVEVEGKRRKTYLIAFIDDMSRLAEKLSKLNFDNLSAIICT